MLTQIRAFALNAAALLLLLPSSCKEKKLSSIRIVERSFDFGSKKVGDTLRHTFVISNSGNDKLKIKGVETSCSCTAGKWSQEPILPGKNGEVSVQMVVKDTGFYKNSIVIEVDKDSIIYPLFISGTATR